MGSIPKEGPLSRLMRHRRAPAEPDPADQGTAYGMELTLAKPAQAAPAPPPRPSGWWGLLGRGTKR